MTSLPGLQGGENGGEEVAGGNATQQPAIAYRSPGYPHTRNNTWFYFHLCDFLFPSGQSIWLLLPINILLKCDEADESFNCCGTGGGSLACVSCRLNVTTDCFTCARLYVRGQMLRSWTVVIHGGTFKITRASWRLWSSDVWIEKRFCLDKTRPQRGERYILQ